MGAQCVTVVTADDALLADVRRLAGVAAVSTVPCEEGGLLAAWHGPAAVVLDGASARRCAGQGWPRRDGLLVVASAEPDVEVWRAAVAVGAQQVLVLPQQERQVAEWLATVAEPQRVGRLVCVLPGRGGAGASTLAAALSFACADAGRGAMLLDADPGGGGIEFVVGIEDVPGARWPEVAGSGGVLPASALSDALPAASGVRVLSCGGAMGEFQPEAVEAVIAAGLRGHDVVVADVARAPAGPARLLVSRADAVVVVVPAEVRAVAAAASLLGEVRAGCADVRVVLRHPGPGDLRPRDVAEATGVPVAATWRWERRLARVVESGRFARSWRRTAVGSLAARLGRDLVQDAA